MPSNNALATLKRAQTIMDHAAGEDRELTQEEARLVKGLLARARDFDRVERELNAIAGNGSQVIAPGDGSVSSIGLPPGTAFVQSAGYKRIADPATRGSRWSSGAIELPLQTKATLLEGDLDNPAAGAALAQPDVQSGIQPILTQPPTVADLIATTQTTSNRVRVIQETTADPGAIGTVAEGGTKPEATLEFDEVDEPVRKIASFLPISDEMLADAPGIQAYLDARLSLFVRQEEENQLLNATGSGTDLVGLLDRVPGANDGVYSDADTPNAADHVYAAIAAAEASYLPSDGIVINPADWAELRLLKDDNLNYIGGSPFSNTGSNPGESLWGKRVIVTTSISSGIALVGAFATGAQLFRRGGLTVEASNSHESFFQKDLVAIRAETRLALGVLRPEAFAVADLSGGDS